MQLQFRWMVIGDTQSRTGGPKKLDAGVGLSTVLVGLGDPLFWQLSVLNPYVCLIFYRYCLEHAKRALYLRQKSSRKRKPRETPETLLEHLEHYGNKPEEVGGREPKRGRLSSDAQTSRLLGECMAWTYLAYRIYSNIHWNANLLLEHTFKYFSSQWWW